MEKRTYFTIALKRNLEGCVPHIFYSVKEAQKHLEYMEQHSRMVQVPFEKERYTIIKVTTTKKVEEVK